MARFIVTSAPSSPCRRTDQSEAARSGTSAKRMSPTTRAPSSVGSTLFHPPVKRLKSESTAPFGVPAWGVPWACGVQARRLSLSRICAGPHGGMRTAATCQMSPSSQTPRQSSRLEIVGLAASRLTGWSLLQAMRAASARLCWMRPMPA